MRDVLTIFRHEFLTLVRRRSFLILVVGLPLLAAILVLILNVRAPSPEDLLTLAMPEAPSAPQGYVDQSGIVQQIPPALAGAFRSFGTVADARLAAERGEISGFFVVPPDYLESGRVSFYSSDFNPLNAEGQATAFRYVLVSNLASDEALSAALWQPMALEEIATEARDTGPTTDAVAYWLPYGLLMLLFMSLSFSSGWLLQSISNEKDTRMLEVILSSVSPVQMLAGKTLGLGAAGLLQLVVWLLTIFLALTFGGRGLTIPEGFSLGLDTLLWAVVFFALGYLVYASLIAGLGALAPSLRDASQATFLVYLPLLIPLWLINNIINQPNGPVAVVLSLVPFTAPVTMAARMARVSPPAWQILLSVGLLLATAYAAISAAARLFRAQTLLSGQALNLASLLSALRGN